MIEIIGTVGGKLLCSVEKDDLVHLLGYGSVYDCEKGGDIRKISVGYKIDVHEAWTFMQTIRGLKKSIEQERGNLLSLAERLVEPKFVTKGLS